ncbi:type i restriction enzyme hsds subunit [Lactobacillus equicursoris DSM 19284 = JCM 14600 = CIP 110162]|uniref:Type i restriction enzyme hsds subunit n=2 Tax=Lactobacillus equicursoris TaxID=420645 RepID=A0A0R1MET0_9LACO|nr:restriction endonuclease subunit S [Lactobacillus equicursoris]KRL02739.1 type i restriction enzyme hsds subunit [Lactobacillus equicursoris DSM 19284 = JCM 14600 = CIP 110162]
MTKRDAKDEKKAPKLRFKGFTDDWEHGHLGDIVKIVMGQSPSSINYTDNLEDHILVQGNADLENGHVVPRVWTKQVTKTADKDDIILSVRAPVGDVGITNYPIVIGRGVAAIKGNKFIYQLLDKMNQDSFWRKYSTGSTFESINSNDLKKAEIFHPNEPEQEKIGKLFQSLDHAIYLHEEKQEQLEQLKKALLQKMFADKTGYPEIRFKGFNGSWKIIKLGKILKIYNEKNKTKFGKEDVLAVSDEFGCVNQIKFHGRSFAGDDLSKYKIVDSNDIIYTKSPLKEKPYGIIKIVGDETGIVSPLYIVNKAREGISPHYIYSYFDIPFRTNYYLAPLVRKGAKNTMNISNEEWLSGNIPVPITYNEQHKIGKFFQILDHTITFHAQKLEYLKQLKRALLQQMFI